VAFGAQPCYCNTRDPKSLRVLPRRTQSQGSANQDAFNCAFDVEVRVPGESLRGSVGWRSGPQPRHLLNAVRTNAQNMAEGRQKLSGRKQPPVRRTNGKQSVLARGRCYPESPPSRNPASWQRRLDFALPVQQPDSHAALAKDAADVIGVSKLVAPWRRQRASNVVRQRWLRKGIASLTAFSFTASARL
jgi:hypothetical protein